MTLGSKCSISGVYCKGEGITVKVKVIVFLLENPHMFPNMVKVLIQRGCFSGFLTIWEHQHKMGTCVSKVGFPNYCFSIWISFPISCKKMHTINMSAVKKRWCWLSIEYHGWSVFYMEKMRPVHRFTFHVRWPNVESKLVKGNSSDFTKFKVLLVKVYVIDYISS